MIRLPIDQMLTLAAAFFAALFVTITALASLIGWQWLVVGFFLALLLGAFMWFLWAVWQGGKGRS